MVVSIVSLEEALASICSMKKNKVVVLCMYRGKINILGNIPYIIH